MTIEWLKVAVYVAVGVSGFVIGTVVFRWIMKLYKWLKLTKELRDRYSEMYEILEETIGEPEETEDEPMDESQEFIDTFLSGDKK